MVRSQLDPHLSSLKYAEVQNVSGRSGIALGKQAVVAGN